MERDAVHARTASHSVSYGCRCARFLGRRHCVLALTALQDRADAKSTRRSRGCCDGSERHGIAGCRQAARSPCRRCGTRTGTVGGTRAATGTRLIVARIGTGLFRCRCSRRHHRGSHRRHQGSGRRDSPHLRHQAGRHPARLPHRQTST